jgi:hypothetical protein
MLEARPAASDRFLDQVFDDGTTLGPKEAVFAALPELMVSGRVANHEAAKPTVAYEDVGTETENEVRYVKVTGCEHGIRKRVGGSRLEEQIGRSADSKCRVWPNWLIALQVARVEPRGEAVQF